MAEPKKKLTRTRSRKRASSNLKLKTSWGSLCEKCKTIKSSHFVCNVCGFYKGQQIIVKIPKKKIKKADE